MGFEEGSIVFDSENNTYYAGQTVHGKLVFDQDKVKKFRGIYVKMKGYCHVRWTTTHTTRRDGRSHTHTVVHESNETYFDRKVYLIGGEDGEHHLNPGHHEFQFEFPIPANCPSSLEGSEGHIRYEVKIVVDRAFKLDQEKKVNIRVFALLDLNADPYCREPIAFEMTESYCCWCMSSGSSETVVKLPVAGYCPGQVIPIEVSCSNKSNIELDQIKLAIKQNTTFRAETNPDQRSEEKTIASIKKGPIPANTTRNWTVEMDVPAIEVYNVNTCRFIDIDYELQVKIEAEGCHNNSEESCRLVIGTIPLVGYQDNVLNPLQDQMPKQPAPLPNATYNPLSNQPTSYPCVNQPYPGINQPYPGANPPYPGVNPPYPGANSNYPNANPPYPGVNPPYPGANSPYPGANPPYPNVTPYPNNTSPYPQRQIGLNPSPYPPNIQQSPVPGYNQIPHLPPTAIVPYPTTPVQNTVVRASAPEPGTPDFDKNQPLLNDDNPPYNPAFKDK